MVFVSVMIRLVNSGDGLMEIGFGCRLVVCNYEVWGLFVVGSGFVE